ncbi:shootin-1 isoform X2 [Rhineura floridana]|uniref:shootin-1 isoform X2 n=1 Tax=Rhineura floridana TaxID=261503 RepID=UPI002AC81790|nr:shootin-1 isoform X2 [Rhineura floridana]
MSSSEEEKQLELISSLKDQAIGEFEDLRAKNKKTREECDKIKQERDEAVKQLEEIQKISHMVIEEVSCIQSHLEIEKTCRESAEALATKLNKENKTLKRISMLYMAKLGPDIITEEINIDDEESSTDIEGSPGTCDSVLCQQMKKGLRDQIISLQEEKKTLAIELENLRSKFVEVNKIKQENAVLTAEIQKQQKVLEKCNQMSVLAVEEYEELQVNFELEKDLRKRAETFAQEMFIEQKKLKRQSQLLLQNAGPDERLLKALDENAKLNQILEEERLQHQQKVAELEKQLANEVLNKEIKSLKQQLELLEEDKKELEEKYQSAEEKIKDLKHSVDELQKRIHQSENVIPPPPPPPPLPPPPPNPIRSLMSMIRKKSHPNSSMMKKEKASQQDSAGEVSDLKRQAVEEMMDRIKKGVHLRPVNQTNRSKTKPEVPKPSESAMKELKGILETMNTSASSRSLKSLETECNETELERILRRRKVTTDQDNSNPTGILASSESKSMPVLGSIETQTGLNKKTLVVELSPKSLGDEQCHKMVESTSSNIQTWGYPMKLNVGRFRTHKRKYLFTKHILKLWKNPKCISFGEIHNYQDHCRHRGGIYPLLSLVQSLRKSICIGRKSLIGVKRRFHTHTSK